MISWIASGLVCIGVGVLEALLSGKDPKGALEAVKQPWWAPPFWGWAAIGIGWYIICFLSLALIFEHRGFGSSPSVILLVLMLANAGWSFVQFRMKRYDLAFFLLLPYAALLLFFLLSLNPSDTLPLTLFKAYGAYLVYAAAWSWQVWRLNLRGH